MAAVSPHEEHTGIIPGPSSSSAAKLTALAWAVGGLCVLALLTMLPLGGPVLLAAWMAIIVAPLADAITRRLAKRRRAAAVLSVGLVLVVLVPLLIVGLSLSASAVELYHRLQSSKSGTGALQALTSGEGGFSVDSLKSMNPREAFDWLQQHAGSALGAAGKLFGAVSTALIALVVFVGAFFAFLSDGASLRRWLIECSPLPRSSSERFAGAFAETGRGMLIGVGVTALLQGAVATVGYLVTGVPQALVLGMVTMAASLIPSIGSGLVWVPVTAGLFLDGRSGAAAVMLGIGLFVSVVDNLIRPVLSRYGNLDLPGMVLFVAMLGGIAAFGAWGLLIGPLFVRLAVEGLNIERERRARALNP